jgi:hypothetical protein
MDELAGSSVKKPEEKKPLDAIPGFTEPKKEVNPMLDEFMKNLKGLKKEPEDEDGKKKKKGPSDSDDEREQNAASKLLDTKTD